MPVSDVWLLRPAHCTPWLWSFSSSVIIAVVSICSKVWFGVFNKVNVHHLSRFHAALDDRDRRKPLITISNHNSILDDSLTTYMCRWPYIFDRDKIRWVPGAKDICFKKYHHSVFFQLGKVIPIVRGDGVYQQCLDFCIDELNNGKWVHLYPEGKINTTKEFMRLKWGVGRLVAECKVAPLVLPYWHVGMDDVMPIGKPYIPQTGKKVTVVIGDPLDFENILQQMKKQDMSAAELRKCITDRLQDEFWRLKHVAEALHYNHALDDDHGHHVTSSGRQIG